MQFSGPLSLAFRPSLEPDHNSYAGDYETKMHSHLVTSDLILYKTNKYLNRDNAVGVIKMLAN